MRRVFQYAVTALLCGSLAAASAAATGCGSSSTTDYGQPPAQDSGADTAGPTTIRVMDNRFDPPSLAVAVGTTIRWINVGLNLHTVTSAQGSSAMNAGSEFDAQLPVGQSFEHTFDTSGEQPYFCRIHESAGMKGTVMVNP